MIRVSAPGSIMITGEHAVVYGHRAIVAAVEQRATVEFTPTNDGQVRLRSEIAPPFEAPLDSITPEGPYRFVLAALARHPVQGADIAITSQINPTLGLGSSAAVTVATLGALYQHLGLVMDGLHAEAHSIIRDIQGRGSGADLAASFHGGMISYCAAPVQISPLPDPPPLSLKYCGYKTPTAEVLQRVAERMEGNEVEFQKLYAIMGETADRAITAARGEEWAAFATALTAYQTHMEALGVSDDTLRGIIQEVAPTPAKISGSGLGDCVVALGPAPEGFTPAPLAQKGLIIHD